MPPNNQTFNPPTTSGGTPAGPLGIPPTPQTTASPFAAQPAPAPGQAPAPTTIGSGTSPNGQQKIQRNPNATQSTLQLSELRDNMVIMADGSFRAVIACTSINFDLMSDREREAVEVSYQDFLNSLNFPVQIVVRSERIDIGPYIERLLGIRQQQDNMLLGYLMDDYINFIDELAQSANIMQKSFFITVPYTTQAELSNIAEQAKGFFGKLFARPKNTVTRIDDATYQKAKDEIANRVNSVMSGLFQIGVKSVQLGTKELGELYYNFYNPDTALRQPLVDFEQATGVYVKKATPEQAQQSSQSQGGTA